MVDTRGERLLGLLVKFGRAALTSEDSTETTETYKEQETIVDPEAEPTMLYWEKDKQEYTNQNQAYIDLYQKGVALEKIPNSVEGKYPESRYKFDNILSYLPDHLANNIDTGIPETPKTGTGISSSGRDAGVVAGIVVAVISGVIILTALIAVLMYRHYVHRNVTSMNFDNPVYRKTTEDQFALEKNGYAPGSKLYPSTVGEEVRALTAMECTLNIQNSLR